MGKGQPKAALSSKVDESLLGGLGACENEKPIKAEA